MRCACGPSVSPRPSARHWRKLEKAIAEARPSKVGATCASNGCGSTRIGFSPALASASPSVAPVRPAPAMITSA